jgi:peptidyl-prolyl cis-trans isomerase C
MHYDTLKEQITGSVPISNSRHRCWTALATAAAMAILPAGSIHATEPVVPPTQSQMATDFLTTIHRMADELARNPDVVVAEIGGQPVTRGDVADAFRTIPGTEGNRPFDVVYHEVVQRLLVRKALAIRAREKGYNKEPEQQRRMTAAADNVLAETYLQRTIAPAVTDEALHKTYDDDIAGKPGPVEVRARVIMSYTESATAAVLASLAAGVDFAEEAKRESKDASASAGGDLGFVRRESVSSEVGAVLFTLAPGQTTAFPVRASGAWFTMKVESRRQLPPMTFDEARPYLQAQLQRVGVPMVMQASLAGLPVKDYGMAGKSDAVAAGKAGVGR